MSRVAGIDSYSRRAAVSRCFSERHISLSSCRLTRTHATIAPPSTPQPLAGRTLSKRSSVAARAPRRSMVVVRAEEDDGPKLTFKANDRAALGFTEADSAGQTNIFAVEVLLTRENPIHSLMSCFCYFHI